jgi:hypothetical protein
MEAEQLSELLAIEQDKKQKLHSTIGQLIQLFTKKESLLEGYKKTFLHTKDAQLGGEPQVLETREAAYTLKQVLEEAFLAIGAGIDYSISKEESLANPAARTDLFIGEVYIGNFSAPALQALETILHRIKEMYLVLPTLDPTQIWEKAEGEVFWKSLGEKKIKMQKTPKALVKYEATPQHPAQTEIVYLEEEVGYFITAHYSGKIKQSQKNKILERLDAILQAVKIAKARIYSAPVQKKQIGSILFNLLHQDIFD